MKTFNLMVVALVLTILMSGCAVNAVYVKHEGDDCETRQVAFAGGDEVTIDVEPCTSVNTVGNDVDED